jgi:hypothetical protein
MTDEVDPAEARPWPSTYGPCSPPWPTPLDAATAPCD